MVKDALKRYKFRNKSVYYRTFGKLLAQKISKVTQIKNGDVIMSIPLSKDRQDARGYNQSYLISNYISKVLRISEKSYILKKIKSTGVQSLMKKNLRVINVEGAFKVCYPERIKGRKVFLIDDILTTGSTLSECSRVLKESGALEVTAVAIASGKKFI
jgi:ComF family protein